MRTPESGLYGQVWARSDAGNAAEKRPFLLVNQRALSNYYPAVEKTAGRRLFCVRATLWALAIVEKRNQFSRLGAAQKYVMTARRKRGRPKKRSPREALFRAKYDPPEVFLAALHQALDSQDRAVDALFDKPIAAKDSVEDQTRRSIDKLMKAVRMAAATNHTAGVGDWAKARLARRLPKCRDTRPLWYLAIAWRLLAWLDDAEDPPSERQMQGMARRLLNIRSRLDMIPETARIEAIAELRGERMAAKNKRGAKLKLVEPAKGEGLHL